jgi:hypothetical protein
MKKDCIIGIGFKREAKKKRVEEFLYSHTEIKHVVYFGPSGMKPLDFSTDVQRINLTYYDAIRYTTYYSLQRDLDKSWLIIYDECMRVKKRRDLTYNSFHHYGRLVECQIVFQDFPFIDEKEDFMILVDLAYPDRYAMTKYTTDVPGIEIHPHHVDLVGISVPVSDADREAYEAEKNRLFDEIGGKDPNTIPRNLEIWVGTRCKKSFIRDLDECVLIARNKRFGKGVCTYADYAVGDTSTQCKNRVGAIEQRAFISADEVTIVDFPSMTKEFLDMVTFSGAMKVKFLQTDLSIDKALFSQYTDLFDEMENFYAGTSFST